MDQHDKVKEAMKLKTPGGAKSKRGYFSNKPNYIYNEQPGGRREELIDLRATKYQNN